MRPAETNGPSGAFRLTALRAFLNFLANSPYATVLGEVAAFLRLRGLARNATTPEAIRCPADALNVLDFEKAARRKLPHALWAYLASGVDDDGTLKANLTGYRHLQLRPRRLRDATTVDMRVELFGTVYESPIFLCPTASNMAFSPEGELAVARAAKARGTLQILSIYSSVPVEHVNEELGRPVWQQLYGPNSWDVCEKILRRVEAAGCSVIALTVDNTTGRTSEAYLRSLPTDRRRRGARPRIWPERPMFDGFDMSNVRAADPAMDWTFVSRLRDNWKGKLILKGIETSEDARLCLEYGVDGIMVSNHGGRSTETLRSTIEVLPEIIAEVGSHVPVFVDGGIRRGTDAFKALALGAKAVGIGRPYLWALAAFGQEGVDRILEIMQSELTMAMGNCGAHTLADIDSGYIAMSKWEI